MSIEIFYFTGTGNSLFVARELNERLPSSKLTPIAAKLKLDDFNTNAETVGFVFPCHGITVPVPVRKFLKKLQIGSANYFFAIVTRGGSIFKGFPLIEKYLKKYEKRLNASFIIDMYMNDPKLKAFELPTIEQISEIEENVKKKISDIQGIILNEREFHDKIDGVTFTKSKIINSLLERLVPFALHRVAGKVKEYFYSDSKCTSCGVCEKVCPSEKIIMEGGSPKWQKDIECYLCYACLNFCPFEAIQIYSKIWMKSYTEDKGRYPHPYAKVKDMINQKNG